MPRQLDQASIHEYSGTDRVKNTSDEELSLGVGRLGGDADCRGKWRR